MTHRWIIVVALGLAGAAYGHGKVTERYIPIGQSPDSSKYTVIGKLGAVDADAKTLRLRRGNTVHRVKITDDTKIWLDRSKLKITNVSIGLDDVKSGQRAEVHCATAPCGKEIIATWVKVEATK